MCCDVVSWFLIAVVLTLCAVLVYQTERDAYALFALRGVSYWRPWPLVGNVFWLVCGWQSVPELILEYYKAAKSSGIFGAYNFTDPTFIVSDIEAIRAITVTDYAHFIDHRPFIDNAAETEPIFGRCLFLLRGDRWRDMRTTLTPAFTGSKLRQMMPMVAECCEQYMQALRSDASSRSAGTIDIETKDLMKRYMIDVIASTAFGYKVDSWQQRRNRIYTTAMDTMHFNSGWRMTKMWLTKVWPRAMRWLGLRLIRPEHVRFYHDLVHGTMAYREREGIVRPDMIQLLADARKGFLKYEADLQAQKDRSVVFGGDESGVEDFRGLQKRYWDEDDITAQCYLFFFAGAENASTLLVFVLQELMENRPVQDRLRAELDEARSRLKSGASTPPFDELMSLPYLDQVVLETLRKWPPTCFMDRYCVQDYALRLSSGQMVQMRAGDAISIPVIGVQRDAGFFAEPERFDPERFSAERRGEIRPFTFLAMGMGPRNCIGWRYAMMAVKALLFRVLTEFELDVGERSQIPVRTEASGLFLRVKGGSWVRLRLRGDGEK